MDLKCITSSQELSFLFIFYLNYTSFFLPPNGSSQSLEIKSELCNISPPLKQTIWCLSYDSSGGEEVGVVAAFLEVHDDVEQRDLVSSSFGVQSLEVFRQDEFVVLPANRRDAHLGFVLFSKRSSPVCGVDGAPSSSLTSAWGWAPLARWAPSWRACVWRRRPSASWACAGPACRAASWSGPPSRCRRTPPGRSPVCCRHRRVTVTLLTEATDQLTF